MADLEKESQGKETDEASTDLGKDGAFVSDRARSDENQGEEAEGKHGEPDENDVGDGGSPKKSRFRVSPLLVFALCLGVPVGFGMGYVDRASQVNQAKKDADTAGAVHGEGNVPSGPCKAWAETICERMGELAHECKTAVKSSFLLSGSTCAQAQESVLAKIDALKAERVPCNELTSKLCTDLGPDGKGCELAIAQEPTFSIARCQNITKNYKQNLAQIMERQEKDTLPRPPRARKPRNVSISKPN